MTVRTPSVRDPETIDAAAALRVVPASLRPECAGRGASARAGRDD